MNREELLGKPVLFIMFGIPLVCIVYILVAIWIRSFAMLMFAMVMFVYSHTCGWIIGETIYQTQVKEVRKR